MTALFVYLSYLFGKLLSLLLKPQNKQSEQDIERLRGRIEESNSSEARNEVLTILTPQAQL